MGRGLLPDSFTSKLLSIRPGETIYLDDTRDTTVPLDRLVQSTIAKSAQLRERRFETERCLAVRMKPASAKPILAITRKDGVEEVFPDDNREEDLP